MKNILIISYTFPPSKGIGGRRWAKFSKYLNQAGNNVFLLTNDVGVSPSDEVYSDFKDVQFLDSSYPKILSKTSSTFKDKLLYKLALVYVKTFSKGNYYDRAAFLSKKFLKIASRLVDTYQISQVIVTGAPFRLLYYGTLLKNDFDVKLLSDFRDPWTWGEGYGMTLLTDKEKAQEMFFEKEVIKKSDIVTVPVKPMEEHLKSVYPEFSHKIKLLTHAYDEDDFLNISQEKQKESSYKLIYGGTIYRNLKNEFDSLYKVCEQNKNVDFTIQIFTNQFQYLSEKKINKVSNKLKISPFIAPGELMAKIQNSDAYILIFPEEVKDFISTKFYEIIYCRVPIIYIGPIGYVSTFIVSNNLGVHIQPNKIKSELPKILSRDIEISYDSSFPIENYSFNKVTGYLLEMLE